MSITNARNLGISEAEDELFGHRTYTWRWQVETDDPKESAYAIATDPRFTQKGYPLISEDLTDLRAVLVRFRVTKQDADPRIAILTQTFSTDIKFPSGDAGSETAPGESGNGITPANWPENPLLQPPTIRGYYIREMVPMAEDLRPESLGGPQSVVNTLGEPLMPPIMVARKMPALAIGINKATIDEAFLLEMQDAVNDAPWRNCSTGTVKAECEWHSEYDAQFGSYWRLEWVFVYNRNGWTPTRYLNASFNKRGAAVAGRYTVVPNKDAYGQPLQTAIPIDVNGDPVPPPVVRTMGLTDGSAVLTSATTTGIAVGDIVSGPGVPSGSTVSSISSGVSVTISAAVDTTGNVAIKFTAQPYYLEFWEYHSASYGTTPF